MRVVVIVVVIVVFVTLLSPLLEPVLLLVLWAEDRVDKALLPPVPFDAAVGHAEAGARRLVVEPRGCEPSNVEGRATDENRRRGRVARELFDGREEQLRSERRVLQEGRGVRTRPERARRRRLPIDDAGLCVQIVAISRRIYG